MAIIYIPISHKWIGAILQLIGNPISNLQNILEIIGKLDSLGTSPYKMVSFLKWLPWNMAPIGSQHLVEMCTTSVNPCKIFGKSSENLGKSLENPLKNPMKSPHLCHPNPFPTPPASPWPSPWASPAASSPPSPPAPSSRPGARATPGVAMASGGARALGPGQVPQLASKIVAQ